MQFCFQLFAIICSFVFNDEFAVLNSAMFFEEENEKERMKE
jgi:hypothetical protein